MAVNISNLKENLKLKIIVEGNLGKEISLSNISRPGLQFAGYYDYFPYDRLQIIGMAEWNYLNTFNKELRQKRLEEFFKFDIPCIVLSRDLEPHEELIEIALKNNITVLQSPKVTTKLVSKITNYLERELAKETTVHGVLVDVYGIGILITGESGIGKSETALELIKRGN